MMIERATVLHYQNGVAIVQCYAKSGCGGCAGETSCGTKALSALAGEKFAPRFEVKVNEILRPGDQIELGLAEKSLFFSLFWLYGLPLMVILASSLLFSQWIHNELLVALLILVTTAITFFTIKKILSRNIKSDIVPQFVRKI
ncbi:transcriptional regulator [Vespertiliibacter pulmonis]|uniref:RseC/MucC-like positive regulator of sigma(E) n=1 Tax=Vespertiliibacter pulmonis TaxID=1443036 RepID=A0A3N4WIK7_9PAST|nr:SoxR reducing system RseC family protein [Vespertiliibacter pulmonis]QLB21349.1 transcriptional regulator [Vespertiliibacter pulmonis]RPE85760.1 RseC/MucC-like positive regulator of sigma(E) [Vespertiliibacter pulmonis]